MSIPTLSQLFSTPRCPVIQHTGGQVNWLTHLVLFHNTSHCCLWNCRVNLPHKLPVYRFTSLPDAQMFTLVMNGDQLFCAYHCDVCASQTLQSLWYYATTAEELLSMGQLCYHQTRPVICQYSSYIYESRPWRYPYAVVLAFHLQP